MWPKVILTDAWAAQEGMSDADTASLLRIDLPGALEADASSNCPKCQRDYTDSSARLFIFDPHAAAPDRMTGREYVACVCQTSYYRAVNTIFQVTGGSLKISGRFKGPRFALEGDGFAFSNRGAEPGHVNAEAECTLCKPGSHVSLGANFAGGFGLGAGPVSLLGKSFDRIYYSGAIGFHGVVDVPVSVSNEQEVAVEAPFQFVGSIRGSLYSHMGPDPDTPIFDLHLAGSGVARLNLIGLEDQPRDRLFSFNSLTYNFQP